MEAGEGWGWGVRKEVAAEEVRVVVMVVGAQVLVVGLQVVMVC
jgi:hypothetical protein